jgi:peroxiredoxin
MGILKIPHAIRPVEIQLKDVYGNTIRLSDFRGKVVFLNFWATWCAACVVEMPSMGKLHRRLKDKDFVMVAINMQESVAQVKAFFEKLKLSFTALLDSDGEVAKGFAVNALPTTFVLDKQGRIVGAAIGPREWDSRASIALFEYLIES